jgi:hypothetical protein
MDLYKVLEDEDDIEFDLDSHDVWIKVYMTLKNNNYVHRCFFEVRVSKYMTITEFKIYMQKSAITIWNQMMIHDMKDITFYFIESI